MEKKHIARILLTENFYVTIISLSFGLGAGILFSKLVLMLLLNLVNFPIPFGFQIFPSALSATVILFGSIFLLTLLKNLRQVHIAHPIELLHGSNTGEQEPKTKWPLATAGLHIAAAFPMLTRLLSVLGLVNIRLFALCTLLTLLLFALFYGFIYMMTAKVYYKIVRAA